MWDPAWWCCARKTDSLDLADRTGRTDLTDRADRTDRKDREGGHNQDYVYVTELLNDVYNADRKCLSGRNVI
jgi:hypothetical protein